MKNISDIYSYVEKMELLNNNKFEYKRCQNNKIIKIDEIINEKIIELKYDSQSIILQNQLEQLSSRVQYTLKKKSLDSISNHIFNDESSFFQNSFIKKLNQEECLNIFDIRINKNQILYITLNIKEMGFFKISKTTGIVDPIDGKPYKIVDQFQNSILDKHPCLFNQNKIQIEFPLFLNIVLLEK